MDNFNKTSYYEIRVHGQLGEMLLDAFPGLRAEIQGAETVLAGVLPECGSPVQGAGRDRSARP